MNTGTRRLMTLLAGATLACTAAFASERSGYGMDVLVNGYPTEEYYANGTVYVEALRGKEYALRLSNPTGRRVAVALSVDGLNTINAKHTNPRNAPKWILEPWETIEISGWQVSGSHARSFYFTGERDSYGAAIGQTENLGVIEAVFFREKLSFAEEWLPFMNKDEKSKRGVEREDAAAARPRAQAPRSAQAPAGAAESQGHDKLDDDYAATGMGDRQRHDVRKVEIDLESSPSAKVRIRYEFRPQLVKLGVLPRYESPLDRRERSRGFDDYCPEPKGRM
ncbi:MAG: hypothetical protein HYU52_13590 [Acidobacteria bacterium]|nr:hypothetical protein [Acidobacteriota bacterium]